jgi:hypothetical protein
MDDRDLEMSLEEIREMARKNPTHPFPYPDIRKLVALDQERYDNLIGHLDMFFSEIAGLSSWGKGILRWPHSRLKEARSKLEKPFFVRHPQYSSLLPLVNQTNVPTLHAKLEFYEQLRKLLLVAVSQSLSRNDP